MTDRPDQRPTNPADPMDHPPALTLDECVKDAREVLAAFDHVRPSEMGAFFYMNGFNQLDSVLRELLRALGANPDA